MSHTTLIRSGAASIGAAALGLMILAGPVSASQGTGDGGGSAKPSTQSSKVASTLDDMKSSQSAQPALDLDALKSHYGVTTKPAESGLSPADVRVFDNKAPADSPRTVAIKVDDNAIEYVQIGLGTLAGMILVGAGAASISVRHHRHPATA